MMEKNLIFNIENFLFVSLGQMNGYAVLGLAYNYTLNVFECVWRVATRIYVINF